MKEDIPMNSKGLSALLFMLVACGVGFASPLNAQRSEGGVNRMFLDAHAPDYPSKYSRSEIKKMIRDANTSADYERLADYFDYRALELEQKSRDEMKELQRLVAGPFHARSYPIQVDSARESIRRYKAQTQECSARAEAYREHATASKEPE